MTVVVGDPEIHIVKTNEEYKIDDMITHFKSQRGEKLVSFIDNIEGINGDIDIATRVLNIRDTIIIASDGANLKYTTGSGYPYQLLKRQIEKSINREMRFEDIARNWYLYLNNKNAIQDDYSAVFVRFENS